MFLPPLTRRTQSRYQTYNNRTLTLVIPLDTTLLCLRLCPQRPINTHSTRSSIVGLILAPPRRRWRRQARLPSQPLPTPPSFLSPLHLLVQARLHPRRDTVTLPARFPITLLLILWDLHTLLVVLLKAYMSICPIIDPSVLISLHYPLPLSLPMGMDSGAMQMDNPLGDAASFLQLVSCDSRPSLGANCNTIIVLFCWSCFFFDQWQSPFEHGWWLIPLIHIQPRRKRRVCVNRHNSPWTKVGDQPSHHDRSRTFH